MTSTLSVLASLWVSTPSIPTYHLRVPHQPAYKRASPHVVNPVHLRRFSLILSLLNKLLNISCLSPLHRPAEQVSRADLSRVGHERRRDQPCSIFGSFPPPLTAPTSRCTLTVPDGEHTYYCILAPIPSFFFAISHVYRLCTIYIWFTTLPIVE